LKNRNQSGEQDAINTKNQIHMHTENPAVKRSFLKEILFISIMEQK